MYIQPYFPEPIEVRGNVAAERYLVTVGFIRAVMAGHFASVLCAAAVAWTTPIVDAATAAWVFLGGLLALTLVRRVLDGGTLDNVLSLALLVPTLGSLGTLFRYGWDAGLPLWVPALAYLFACTYGVFCGRDHSFVGQFMVTAIALTASLLVVGIAGWIEWADAAFWWLMSLVFVFYYVYDLAALLSRRRLGEAPAAVADLYRDLLNFMTYTVRVVLHWRRFRFI